MERLTIDEAINHARKVVLDKSSEMSERIIGRRDASDCKKCMEQHEQLVEWLEELKAYKDLEEQGKLLKLPCVVGDVVYRPNKFQHRVCEHVIEKIEMDSGN